MQVRPPYSQVQIQLHPTHPHIHCPTPPLPDCLSPMFLVLCPSAELSCGTALADSRWDAFENVQYSPQEVADALGMPRREIRKDRVPCAPHPDDAAMMCCASSAVVCTVPERTAGLGDSISGAGLTFQSYLAKSDDNEEL